MAIFDNVADHERTTMGVEHWRHIPNGEATRHLARCPHYDGALKGKTPEQVAFLLAEAINYFALDQGVPPPAPYDGAYGVTPLEPHVDAMKVWNKAMTALVAVANGKPRSLKAAWQEMKMLPLIERRAGGSEQFDRLQSAGFQKSYTLMTARMKNEPKRLVYFIGSEGGPIKIGVATKPVNRLKELQTSHHERLSIIVTAKGGQAQESAYHKQFAAHRLHGEWFARHPDILAEIERLAA